MIRPTVSSVQVSAYTIPTDFPESDGTMAWNETTIVVVRLAAGGSEGLGYSYADAAAGQLIRGKLGELVVGMDPMNIPGAWRRMQEAVRNLGRPGIAAHAIAAVDVALWDLKARLLGLPLADLFGRVHPGVAVYGSGGFTSYPEARLCDQLAGWVEAGIGAVKMKVGREPESDGGRVAAARRAIGDAAELFVDANGAYARKQALDKAAAFAGHGVSWFEEPVSSDDLEGLRLIRDRAPPGMAITAGEYGYDPIYFRRMLEAGAVDILQADATRCLGISGVLRAGALCEAFSIPLSAHTAPSLHLHPFCALPRAHTLEFFHDHVRIEQMLFDGAPIPREGILYPGDRPGLGLELKESDGEPYAV
jgi:L-alanine-DL-glutamate epimerase-like enolase superfamily enzyme